jgi:hypothetical protein
MLEGNLHMANHPGENLRNNELAKTEALPEESTKS